MQSFTILLAKICVLQVAPEPYPDTAVFTAGVGQASENTARSNPGERHLVLQACQQQLSTKKGVSFGRGLGSHWATQTPE